jgi:hypothetical protein
VLARATPVVDTAKQSSHRRDYVVRFGWHRVESHFSKPPFATTSGIATSFGLTAAFDSKCPHRSAKRHLLPRRSATAGVATYWGGSSTSTSRRVVPLHVGRIVHGSARSVCDHPTPDFSGGRPPRHRNRCSSPASFKDNPWRSSGSRPVIRASTGASEYLCPTAISLWASGVGCNP